MSGELFDLEDFSSSSSENEVADEALIAFSVGTQQTLNYPTREQFLQENFSVPFNGTTLSFNQVQNLVDVGLLTSDYQIALTPGTIPTSEQIQAAMNIGLLSPETITSQVIGTQINFPEREEGLAILSDLRAQIANIPENVEGVSFAGVITASNQFADEYESELNAFSLEDAIEDLIKFILDHELLARILAIIIYLLFIHSNIAELITREIQRALREWQRLLFPSMNMGIIVHEVRRTTVDGRQVNVRPLSDNEVRRRGLHVPKQKGKHGGREAIFEDIDTGELYIGSRDERTPLNPFN